MESRRNPLFIILAFFSIYFIWGSTYLLNKIAVTELAPFMLAGIRFTTAGILILLLCRLLRIKPTITRQQLGNATVAGFLFLTVGNGVVVWALKFVDSGFAALIISAQPLVVLIFLRILKGKRIKPMSLIGVGLGILGIYLLISQRQVTNQENSYLGIFMIFICLLSWSYGSIFVGKVNLPSNHFVSTAYQMIAAGVLLVIASLAFNEPWSLPTQWSQLTLLVMILLILFGSIVAFTAFNYLLKIVSPEKVATSTYVNPVIAMLLGWYFLDEQITTQSVIAAAILLTGVFFINTKRKIIIFSRFANKVGRRAM